MARKTQKAVGTKQGIVVGDVSGSRTKLYIKLFAGTLAVIVVLGAIGAGIYLLQHKDAKQETTNDAAKKSEQLVEQQYNQTAKELDKKLASAKTAEEKSDIYRDIASNERTTSNYSEAYQAALKAVKEKPSSASYASLALAALQNGDKKAAADAYQKASELATGQAEKGQSGYEYYQQLKAQVEKS